MASCVLQTFSSPPFELEKIINFLPREVLFENEIYKLTNRGKCGVRSNNKSDIFYFTRVKELLVLVVLFSDVRIIKLNDIRL